MSKQKASAWMRAVLWSAAAYNLLWGAAVVLFPLQLFRLGGLQPPTYPELIQCLGMVIGVYGVAYAIAGLDVYRYWPLVLVGLLGKVLGPIGFLNAAMHSRLPWRMGWMILANDVIWWVPFGLILAAAHRSYICKLRSLCPDVVRFALRSRTSCGQTLEHLSYKAPVLLVFLRHLGCTFCKEALDDIATQRHNIERGGARIVLVHMGSEDLAAKRFKTYGLDDIPRISDPCQNLYRAFGLKRGTLSALFGPRVVFRGFGLLPRYGLGRMIGDGFQMPGVFLIYHGEVIRSYRHQSVADRPEYAHFVSTDGGDALDLGVQA